MKQKTTGRVRLGKAAVPLCGMVAFLCVQAALCGPPDERLKPASGPGQISNPSKFKVGYSLKQDGARGGAYGAQGFDGGAGDIQIAVNVLDARFYPVKAYVVRNAKGAERVETLWDGRDVYGKESPPGPYYASLSIVYPDGKKETKFFKFVKE